MRNLMKKYKILLVVEIILFLVLLPGCFKQAEQVYSVNGIVGSVAQGSRFQSTHFPVEPGVYQVRAKLDDLKDGYVYVNADCEKGEFRGFRCNGVTMFSDQTYLDFEIYVLEYNDLAYVTLDFGNQEPAQMLSLEVFRTNLGARMAVFILLLAYCVLNGLVIFREGIMAGRIKKEQQMVFWGLSLSVFLAFFPYLTDYLINGTDSMFYWTRIEVLKENMIQGDSFFFDIFLMFPALLRMIGFSLMGAYKMFVFVVMVATAWIAYFSLKKCTGHTYAALFGSVIYVLSPYRISILYNRGAVGEYLAMMFWPLVITGIYKLLVIFMVLVSEIFFKRNFRRKTGRFFGKKERYHKNSYDKKMLFWSLMILCGWFVSIRYFQGNRIAGIVSAFCAVTAAFFYLWLEEECKGWINNSRSLELSAFGLQKVSGDSIRIGIISLLLILTVCSAVYRVNDIVIQGNPIWLYNAENMGEINVENAD